MRGSTSSPLSQHQRHSHESLCEKERLWQWKQHQGGLKPHKTPEKEVVEETSTHKRGFCIFFSIARFSPVQIISPFCPCVQAQHSESHKPLEGLFPAGFASKLVVSELFLSSSWVNCVTGGCGIILVPSAGNFWKQKVPGVIGLLVSLRPRIWVSQAGRAPQGLSLPNPELELLSPPLPGGEEGQIKIFFFFLT